MIIIKIRLSMMAAAAVLISLLRQSEGWLPATYRRRISVISSSSNSVQILSRLSSLSTSTNERNNQQIENGVEKIETTMPKRRQKKNKYADFSKVEDAIDPMEVMIKESEQKIQKLQKLEAETLAQIKNKNNPQVVVEPVGRLQFPNNKDIDPYDPTTFGYVEIGLIIGAHGVHGWIKLQSTTDFANKRLCEPGIRHLRPAKKRAPRPVVLVQGKHRHLDEYLIKLEGIDDRDEAAKLRGSVLYVREEDKAETNQEEYIVSDLVGIQVYLQQNGNNSNNNNNSVDTETSPFFVGYVGGVVLAEEMCSIPGLGHDMLEIVLPRGRNGLPSFRDELVLVPFVPQIVTQVNIAEQVIHIDPPPGLLDLTYVREEKVRLKGLLPPASEP